MSQGESRGPREQRVVTSRGVRSTAADRPRPCAAQAVDKGTGCVQRRGGPQPGKQDTRHIISRQNQVLPCTKADEQVGVASATGGVGNALENLS